MPHSATILSFLGLFWLKHTKTQLVSGSCVCKWSEMLCLWWLVSRSINLVETLRPRDNTGDLLSVQIWSCSVLPSSEQLHLLVKCQFLYYYCQDWISFTWCFDIWLKNVMCDIWSTLTKTITLFFLISDLDCIFIRSKMLLITIVTTIITTQFLAFVQLVVQ